MANTIPYIFPQFFDDSGNPLTSGYITSKAAGTSSDKDTFGDYEKSSTNPNPIPLASNGRPTYPIFLEDGMYDFKVYNSSDVQIAQQLGISGSDEGGSVSVPTVETIEELLNLPNGFYDYVEVLGYNTPGDGGGGKFKWTTGITADGGWNLYTISSAGPDGWRRMDEGQPITPEQFGAKGDGSTDDYGAITSARNYIVSLANGGTLEFDNKVYFFGTNLSFSAKCMVHFVNGTVLKSTNKNVTFLDSFLFDSPNDCFDLGTGVVTYGIQDENECIVNTLADLRALPSAKYKYVSILGHTVVGDGGNGRFVYNSSSSATDNNGTIIKLTATSGSGRYEREVKDNIVNACWFGFRGTGESGLPQSQAIMSANVKALMRATRSSTTGVGTLLVPSRNVWYGINSTIVPGGMVLKTSLTGVTTSVVVDAILEETPQTGTLYISKDSRDITPISVSYTAWSGTTFTIASTDFTATPCTAGNTVLEYNKTSRGSNWKLHGQDSTIYWGGIAGGRMFECSDPYLTFVEMKEIKLRGWHAGAVSSPEMVGGGFAGEGANYGRTNIGHFHYYFKQITATWFLANDSSTPFVLNPNGGGNNGGNDFEFLNCYTNYCGSGIILGLPDQSFINCTFQNVNIAAQMGANSRASFIRCYLGALKAVFQISPGCVGINVSNTWFEQTGTLIKYATPGTLVELPAGLNITACRFAPSLVYGNVTSEYPVLLQQPSTISTALTGVTTSIVASAVLSKETTTEGGIPDRGWLRVYANTGTVYKVYYSGFNHGTKTFSGIKNHFRLATTLSSAGTTSVVVDGSIPAHTKSSGNLVITLDDGTTTTVAYSSWSTSTFTISSTDFSTNTSRVGRLVQADTDFTSVPASSGNLLQIQRNGSFLDTRDITGNINLIGGDFAGENGNNDITIDPNYANVNIDNVKNSNYWPVRFVNTSGTDIEGGAGVYIKDSGRQAYGLKAKRDYGSEGDFISFTGTIATTGLANNTAAAYSFSLPGAVVTQNRPILTVYCYDTDRVFVTARVSSTDTLSISVFNSTGGALASGIKIYGFYKTCLRNEILI